MIQNMTRKPRNFKSSGAACETMRQKPFDVEHTAVITVCHTFTPLVLITEV